MLATLTLAISLLASPVQTEWIETDAAPIEVMVLGSYHFTGGGQDLHNAQVDDHLAPERQAEIAEVLDALADFEPTKVMVELTPEHEDAFNAAYQAYLAGEHSLTVNERQQLGMRLAARLGHERLYAIDQASDMDFEGMMGAAQDAGQDRLLGEFGNFNAAVPVLMQDMESGSVMARLRASNSQFAHDAHGLYLTLAQTGTIEDPIGVQEMGEWWTRNLAIFANAARHAEPGDRLLLIYGAGHKHLLEQFFEDAPGFRIVDPLDTLEE
ncbi:DUF5694 domain-containing protein [Oceanicaulis sp.]|uniref:DUF5694 domain-containing protein n=1 Tax=Oceanicaulis sp. TaxID=1924941 RepID=UPI003BAA181E